MSFFKRRGVAWSVLVLCALLALALGQYKPLRQDRAALTTLFYDGDAYAVSGYDQLCLRQDAAANLVTIAARNGVDTAAVTAALDACDPAASIPVQLRRDAALGEAVEALYDAMGRAALSDEDARYRSGQYADFTAAADRLKRCGFADAAAAFNAAYGGGLYALLGVDTYPLP